MNLKEIKQPSDKKLFEQIDPNNDTGFLTEDLVSIARQQQSGNWVTMTEEELIEHINQICGS